MVHISQLTEEIRDLGQRVLELEGGFSLKKKIDDGQINAADAFQSLFALSELFAQFRNLKGRDNIGGPISESLANSEEYSATLSLKLLPHDFKARAGLFQWKTLDLRGYVKENKTRYITKLFEDQIYFTTYENLRIGLNTIAYLALGDKKFLVPVQCENVPTLLAGMYAGKPKCSFDFGDASAISSDQ